MTTRGEVITSPRYILGLDGFRAIAVLLMMFVHAFAYLAPPIYRTSPPPGGFIGVDMLGGATVIAIACAVVVAWLLTGTSTPERCLQAVLEWSVLKHLGLISYGLYLWHVPVIMIISERAPGGPVVRMLGSFVASVIMAELSMRFVESPFLRLKNKFAGCADPGVRGESCQPATSAGSATHSPDHASVDVRPALTRNG